MKLRLVALLAVFGLLCACAAPAEPAAPAPEAPTADASAAVVPAADAAPPAEYDEDLTKLSETMRYSEVMHIQAEPEKYIGKTIKLEGYFYIYESDIRNVYVCLVPDSTACCTAGLEFRLAGEHKFPDDYPKTDELITVAGTFGAYSDDEGEHTAYELQEACFIN